MMLFFFYSACTFSTSGQIARRVTSGNYREWKMNGKQTRLSVACRTTAYKFTSLQLSPHCQRYSLCTSEISRWMLPILLRMVEEREIVRNYGMAMLQNSFEFFMWKRGIVINTNCWSSYITPKKIVDASRIRFFCARSMIMIIIIFAWITHTAI